MGPKSVCFQLLGLSFVKKINFVKILIIVMKDSNIYLKIYFFVPKMAYYPYMFVLIDLTAYDCECYKGCYT